MDAARGRHDLMPTVRAPGPRAPAGASALRVEDAEAVARVVDETRPDWIVHAGALTDVDACERDPDAAFAVNARGTENLARAARRAGARLAYVSTDYVFDGERGAYRETDEPRPINVYGASKLEGERRAAAALDDLVVLRTSVVYAPERRNFVTWVAGNLGEGKPIRVAADQRVSPTSAVDLARLVLALVEADARGTYHAAGATPLTRHEMATLVARELGLDETLIIPVKLTEIAWAAPRPKDSTLDVTKITKHLSPEPFADGISRFRRTTRGPVDAR